MSAIDKPKCGHLDWCCNDNGQVDMHELAQLNGGMQNHTHPATIPAHMVNQLQQTTWAIGGILDVLTAEDDSALKLGDAIRGKLITALRVIHCDSLSAVMEDICSRSIKAEQSTKKGGAA